MRKKLLDSLKRVFRPEFINRLDSVIVFRALSREDIHQIVNLELDKVAERLQEAEIKLTATPIALDRLAEEGYDPEMGARPLRRVIQLKVEDRLSDAVLVSSLKQATPSWLILIQKRMKLSSRRRKHLNRKRWALAPKGFA
jgi:ATP-dependent Clp protease ATP-binding subunit ClpC